MNSHSIFRAAFTRLSWLTYIFHLFILHFIFCLISSHGYLHFGQLSAGGAKKRLMVNSTIFLDHHQHHIYVYHLMMSRHRTSSIHLLSLSHFTWCCVLLSWTITSFFYSFYNVSHWRSLSCFSSICRQQNNKQKKRWLTTGDSRCCLWSVSIANWVSHVREIDTRLESFFIMIALLSLSIVENLSVRKSV